MWEKLSGFNRTEDFYANPNGVVQEIVAEDNIIAELSIQPQLNSILLSRGGQEANASPSEPASASGAASTSSDPGTETIGTSAASTASGAAAAQAAAASGMA